MSKVGVVLVNYHTDEDCVSIAKFYEGCNVVNHIIIVNNDTCDETAEVFARASFSSKVKISYQKENLGYSKGNNIGICMLEELGCDFVIISNSDVVIEPSILEKNIDVLAADNDLAAIAPIMRDVNGIDYPLRKLKLGYLRLFARIFMSERRLDQITNKGLTPKSNGVILQSFLPGSLFVAKMSALKESESFDPNVFLYREEEILAKRFERKGYHVGVLSNTFYIHTHPYSDESVEKRTRKFKLIYQSEQYFFQAYLHSGRVGMCYVKIMQSIQIFIRRIGWSIRSKGR